MRKISHREKSIRVWYVVVLTKPYIFTLFWGVPMNYGSKFKRIITYIVTTVLIFSFLVHFTSLTVYASAVEAMTEAELLRQSFQVLEGGAVNSSFTGFEVIEGGLSVAEKEAMVSSFGSQILAGAKALGYNVAIAGATAVTEYTALEVGYHALDAIMDSSAGDEITKLWLNTFSTCAYSGISSLETEKAVLTSNMLGGLESLLNEHYNGEFELNSGLVGNSVALGSNYFQNATSTGVEAYKALNTTYQATFVFNGDTSTQYMSHYFVNGATYGIISNGTLTLYNAKNELCTISNSNGKCTTSFILGNDFYGLTTYSSMTNFSIALGNVFKMISGSGIRLYEDSLDNPITNSVTSPITIPDVPFTKPLSITIPLDTDSALAIANGDEDAEIEKPTTSTDTDTTTPTNTASSAQWSSLWDWLQRLLDGILSIPSAILDGLSSLLQSLFVPSEAVLAETKTAYESKFVFATQIDTWIDDLMEIMSNPEDYASNLTFTVDMSKATDTYWDYGDSKSNAFNMSWYMQYKDTVDDIIVGIAWLVLLWNLHGQLPSIISAVHSGTYSIASLDYQKSSMDLRREEMEIRKDKVKTYYEKKKDENSKERGQGK